jgi:hypothetical protein
VVVGASVVLGGNDVVDGSVVAVVVVVVVTGSAVVVVVAAGGPVVVGWRGTDVVVDARGTVLSAVLVVVVAAGCRGAVVEVDDRGGMVVVEACGVPAALLEAISPASVVVGAAGTDAPALAAGIVPALGAAAAEALTDGRAPNVVDAVEALAVDDPLAGCGAVSMLPTASTKGTTLSKVSADDSATSLEDWLPRVAPSPLTAPVAASMDDGCSATSPIAAESSLRATSVGGGTRLQ